MLKIKLARFGKKNQPHYRMVVTEAKSKRDGKYVEKIGHYAPAQTPKILEIDVKRYNYWVSQGATPTDTVAALFKRYQSGKPFPPKKKKLSKKAKAKLAEADKEKETKEVEKDHKETTEKSDETKENEPNNQKVAEEKNQEQKEADTQEKQSKTEKA